jgi:hypothetical protein
MNNNTDIHLFSDNVYLFLSSHLIFTVQIAFRSMCILETYHTVSLTDWHVLYVLYTAKTCTILYVYTVYCMYILCSLGHAVHHFLVLNQ